MAEALAKEIIRRSHFPFKIEVASAGLAAFPGAPASPEAVAVLADRGIDLSDHCATQLTEDMVRWADLIFTMTAAQKRHLLETYPEAKGKVFVLKEFLDLGRVGEQEKAIIDLLARIKEKKEKFQREYGEAIKKLEQQRSTLLQQIQQIEDQIAAFRELLEKEIEPEKQGLRRLEEQMSKYDISDPIGEPRSVYEKCAQELEEVIEKIFRKLTDRDF
jgi:protein-tyrosine phosphatase